MPLALVTGGSRGLGRAVATALADAGFALVLTGRDAATLDLAASELAPADVRVVPGDVADGRHRDEVVAAVGSRLDLLVNNAGTLGPTPRPRLEHASPDALLRTLEVNVVAQVALTTALVPALSRAGGTVVSVTSDAAVEAWEGWGAYGLSKAALEHATRVLRVEHPGVTFHVVDPGDLRTDMHQAAFPDEDISDRPWPSRVAPRLVDLVTSGVPGDRYRLAHAEVGA